jgi:hypothetical protein
VQGSGFRVRGCRVCLLLLLGAKLLRMVGVLRRLSKLLLLLLLLRRVRGSGSFHPGRYNTREFPDYIFFLKLTYLFCFTNLSTRVGQSKGVAPGTTQGPSWGYFKSRFTKELVNF